MQVSKIGKSKNPLGKDFPLCKADDVNKLQALIQDVVRKKDKSRPVPATITSSEETRHNSTMTIKIVRAQLQVVF